MTLKNKNKLAAIEKKKQEKLRNQAMKNGVTLKAPETIFLSNDTKFGKNVVINQYVVIGKKTVIGNNVEILPFTHIEQAILESNVSVGPFSRIRPGSLLGVGSKIGNFVETKKAHIGAGSKASHLAYLGDADIGIDCNIGAGTVTCNYDGVSKNETKIGDNVFIGTNATLVAPLVIDSEAFVAAGSTITTDVSDSALAVGRAKQKNIDGWVPPSKRK